MSESDRIHLYQVVFLHLALVLSVHDLAVVDLDLVIGGRVDVENLRDLFGDGRTLFIGDKDALVVGLDVGDATS